jgi:hypothetical protein
MLLFSQFLLCAAAKVILLGRAATADELMDHTLVKVGLRFCMEHICVVLLDCLPLVRSFLYEVCCDVVGYSLFQHNRDNLDLLFLAPVSSCFLAEQDTYNVQYEKERKIALGMVWSQTRQKQREDEKVVYLFCFMSKAQDHYYLNDNLRSPEKK